MKKSCVLRPGSRVGEGEELSCVLRPGSRVGEGEELSCVLRPGSRVGEGEELSCVLGPEFCVEKKSRVLGARFRRRGFTLVEALVAMVVIALVLPVALQGVSLAMQLGADAKLRGEAAQLAKGKLDELAATGAWQDEKLNGEFEGQAGTVPMTWTATVGGWSDGSLNELEVTVTYKAAGKTRSVSMVTLVNPEAE